MRGRLRSCGGCSRHVHDEPRCPFCGTQIGVVSMLPFALSLLIAGACTDRVAGSGSEDESGSTSMSIEMSTSTSTSTLTTSDDTTTDSTMGGSTSSVESSSGSTGIPACDDDTSGDTSGGGFIYGAPVPASECDTFVDEDCRECPDGEKCMPYSEVSSWDGTMCSPVAPDPAGVGEPCVVIDSGGSGLDNCDAASMCWNVDADTLEGTCVAFCHGPASDPWCDDPSTTCVVTNPAPLTLCLPACDPIAQDCGPGRGCYPAGGVFACTLDASEDSGAYGEPCVYINACDPGLFCALQELLPDCDARGCCTPFCDLGDADAMCPDTGQECVPWFEEGSAPDGLEDLGSCVAP